MQKEDYKVYEDKMKKSIESVAADFASVRAGRANASVLDRIMVDYYGSGVVTVLVFYLCRGRSWGRLGQLAGLVWLNCYLLGGMLIPVTLLGHTIEISEQGLAVLALIPIWLYNGKQGPHSRAIQYACYAFYPLHMLVLALMRMYL